MNDYLGIANSNYFYFWGGIILIVILIQSILFIRLAWKEGKRIGLTSKRMLNGMRTGMVAAIIPSISIVLFLISMSDALGIPVPWIRLSVIGSGPYEIIAAGIGKKEIVKEGLEAAGYARQIFANSVWSMTIGAIWSVREGLEAAEYARQVFANSVWVMTIGAMWSGLMVFFFNKKLKKLYKKIDEKIVHKYPDLMKVIVSAAFFGVICIFIAPPIVTGGVPLITMITGALLMTICALLIKKFEIKWLREFALPFSMIGAMASAIIFARILA